MPKKRATARARASKAGRPVPEIIIRTQGDDFNSFPSTKEDKRRLKHSSLVSRIEKANAKTHKRRRSSKKLVTTLESLAGALPEATQDGSDNAITGGTRIRHASLKSRPGALKRKEQLEGLERERFAKNMAQMSTGQVPSGDTKVHGEGANSTSSRWAALRGFIRSTMSAENCNVK